MRGALTYALLLIAIWTGIFWMSPRDQDLPPRSSGPTPTLVVRDLVVAGGAGHLGFTAAEARPSGGSGPITVAGGYEGLVLRRVRVDLEPGTWLLAKRGSFVGQRLSLEGRVSVRRGDRDVLEAGRVAIHGDDFRFEGVVVLHTAAGVVRDDGLVATRAELLARLR